MIFSDFAKAIAQLGDSRFQRVMFMGLGLTITLLIAIYALLLWLIQWSTDDTTTVPGIGEVTWIGDLLSWGSLGLMIIASFFLMVPVASAITSLFLDDVADAVESKHYSHLPSMPRVKFWDGLRDSVNFFGVLIGANVLAFAIYAVVPWAAIFIFYALNGFLLGREYFHMIAMRREGRKGAKAMGKKHMVQIWMAGCLMAVPLSIPLINLLIPILGAATFTHLYHRLSRG